MRWFRDLGWRHLVGLLAERDVFRFGGRVPDVDLRLRVEAIRGGHGATFRGVRLDRPFLSQFTYFTTWAETDGSLRVYSDPYNYDARLAEALGLRATLPTTATPDA